MTRPLPPTDAPPLILELEEAAPAAPQDAPPVPEVGPDGSAREGDASGLTPAAAAGAALAGGGRAARLGRWTLGLGGALVSYALGLWAWDFVTGLLARSAVLGGIALVLAGGLGLGLLAIALREVAGVARLGRLDHLQRAIAAARAGEDLPAARSAVSDLMRLYGGAPDRWARDRIAARLPEVLDADALIALAEAELVTPRDARAEAAIQGAARQVAAVTALVPLALADVAVALVANLRMIRQIGLAYGGRGGLVSSLRLVRLVLGHMVATGAVAMGDDLIGSVAGGGIVGKLSRRAGEGVVNAALTARIGIATIEVCRPVPLSPERRPSVARLVSRAITGLVTG